MKNFIRQLSFELLLLLSFFSFTQNVLAQTVYDMGTWNTSNSYSMGTWNPSTSYSMGTWNPSPTTVDTYSVVPVTTTYPATTDTYSVVPVTYGVTNTSNTGGSNYGYTNTPSYTNSGSSLFGNGFNFSTPSFSFSLGGNTGGYTNFGYTGVTGYTNLGTTAVTCGVGQTLVNGVCTTNVICGAGQTLVNGVCTTTITCGVGTTLINGVCQPTTCPVGQTLVNNVCQAITCPAGQALLNGVCQITSCPVNTTLINGVCQSNCGAGTTLVNGVCQATSCAAGQTLINGVCQINTITCPANTTLLNGVCQPSVVCPSGSSYINGTCQASVSCPAGTILLNGTCQGNSYTNLYGYTGGYTNYGSYQTCWDGSVISSGQVCAQQYKTCSNGSMVPASQVCYMTCPNGQSIPEYMSCPYTNNSPISYSAPIKIDFNNVVTSVTTQITKNSARCNGIGLIAGGAPSTGWFEYGETPNLGRDTAKVSIGSDYTAPFSNILTNLKTNNTYFCRAVMSNQHGIVKGEIVRFTTTDKNISYVAPKTAQTIVKKVKNEITCSDGTVLKTNPAQASIINNGDKLVTTVLEKVTGEISPGNEINYRFNYKNISGSRLDDTIIKIVVPQEFSFVNSNVGSFDDKTHTLIFNQNILDGSSEGVISFKVKVVDTASLGKSVVTTGYLSYTFKSSGGKLMADEVIAYSVGSIIPTEKIGINTGAKKVVGTSTESFLPSSLVEWFALIAIMFILYILGRSIYATYNEEEKKRHH